jgi:hypothetical protein
MNEQTSASELPGYGVGSLVSHPEYGVGRVLGYEGPAYVLLFKGGQSRRVAFTHPGLRPVTLQGDPALDRIKQAVGELLGEHGWLDAELELGARWAGGRMDLIPGKEGTQNKSIPIEDFFKKIIGVREKLRVLEQKINNHPALSPEEKLDLEGYITRCYGSLTTFNTLFAGKESYFRGSGGGRSGADAESS